LLLFSDVTRAAAKLVRVILPVGVDDFLVNFPACRVDDLDQQAGVVVEMSMPQDGGKLLAVLDRFRVKRKAHLEAVESAVTGFHIEEVRF
jgi:hypothetical protein